MSEEVTSGKNPNKKLIVILAVAVVLIAAVIIIFFLRKSGLTAITMRILRIEGTVSLEENGKEKPVKENLRLNEGNALNTATASIASVGLDEYKIVTLNEESRAEFNKLGKKLDLSLTEGSMYVDVQKKLDALACYQTYAGKYYFSPEVTRATLIRNGAICERHYAEGFDILRIVADFE